MCTRGVHSSYKTRVRIQCTSVSRQQASRVKSEWSSFWRRLIFMRLALVLGPRDAGTDVPSTCAMGVCSGLLGTVGVPCLWHWILELEKLKGE